MKINGTGQPPGPEGSTAEGLDKAAQTREATGAGETQRAGESFGEKLSGTAPGAGARPPGESGAVGGAGESRGVNDVVVNDLASDLRAGKLTPQAAIDKVVERVMSRQLGPEAPPAVRDRVRLALQEALESDPLLAAKLSRLH